jgi:diaminopimelate epimerase
MAGTTFYKMSGSGNDFVMFDGRSVPAADITAARIVELCDRRLGIGADGLAVLTPDGPDRIRMDFWNCDGSRADMCGNAALCSTRLATTLAMVPPTGMELVTRAGVFRTRIVGEGEGAELNLPDFALPVIPQGLRLRAGESLGALATCGVPHLAVVVEDLETEDLMDRGRQLRYDPCLGPAGANVNFVGRTGPEGGWSVRTYERGVEGETLACGTGAVATAVSLSRFLGLPLPLDLYTRSGRILRITATLSDDRARDVWLAGEGRRVFTGTF